MFTSSQSCLRSAAVRASRLPSLRRRLQRLRHTNRAAEDELQERRRLHSLLRDSKNSLNTSHFAGGHSGSSCGSGNVSEATTRAIRLLPRNDALEAAMALSISENRDARTELELMRRLINSTLLSLASPVDRTWDPYDVKPQVFALNTYIALPVFTSIHYLRLFCQRFGFAVRDPSGVLWAAGAASTTEDVSIAGLLPDAVVQSEWWQHHRHAQPVHTTEVNVDESAKVNAAHNSDFHRDESTDKPTSSVAGMSTTHSGEGLEASAATEANPGQNGEQTPGRGGPSALPTAEPLIDASALFDVMMLEGVADEATETTSARERCEKKRERRREASSASSRGVTTRRLARGCDGTARRKKHRKRRLRLAKRGGSQERRSPSVSNAASAEQSEDVDGKQQKTTEESAAKSAYWQAVAQTAPFELKQATPLPTFGPFLHPFLLGYFADISTLLHNAAIVPEKVDIVVNPGSPIEFVLARAATDRVLHKEQLLHLAYLKVEKELQREFSNFFSLYCPEVLYASSACVPLPMDREEVQGMRRASRTAVKGRAGAADAFSSPLQEYRERTRLLREAEYRNGVAYELTILIQSTSLEETFMKIQHAKHQSMLMGHAELDVLPEAAAAPHVREMSHRFYDGVCEQEKLATQQTIASHAAGKLRPHAVGGGGECCGFSDANPSAASLETSKMGVFLRRGTPRTINVAQSADSYFHDPTNAYTEAHAVFTEELKVKRGQ
ncbi:putative mitochondrial hypothetical protein [Leptomonas pyrrhocoris]|uniref:Uncharacterized protein n=1 Tax=Leptomonas pyrrhocoris TaxID=157538 RepID=A0A0N0DVQ7_LEPPY|nr:putative mitochondrial hypothetical protein [Leptomonas pyrrhocoris]KPA80454.1 putative mitochondrial hypothetical protein [Leptomonas pyrrhocoris]|eukprot:XP_015658893.1 putative mitochondrial hypothetical protein [Leptomonas pyrrhocoris]